MRRGDVIGLRLEALNPVPYTAGTGCAARYYMDHQGRFALCAQYIMQRTAVCRLYPIKAIVIWDEDEMGRSRRGVTWCHMVFHTCISVFFSFQFLSLK